MTLALLGLLPWVVLGAYMAARVRLPRPLPPFPDGAGGAARPGAAGSAPLPSVSVVVPARNEAHNIRACIESLAASRYLDFEIIVVDDRSDDGTAAVARAVPAGNARRIRVIAGEPLPAGWFGKPWACRQGADVAGGEVLLFTDADTRHHPELLARAVAGLLEDGVEALSLLGRQLMETFWEHAVQPQIFFLIGMRFPALERPFTPERWRDAIANGQFILIHREPYEAIGGHAAVRKEVVEDLRLAQEVCRAGGRVAIREAEEIFATRMYRSLGELVAGWSKNVAWGARQTLRQPWAALALPGIVLHLLFFWVVPPVTLVVAGVAAVIGALSVTSPLLAWSAGATGIGLVIWMAAARQFHSSPARAVFFPLGAAVATWIVIRSWTRGARIEWKGRRYTGGEGEAGGVSDPRPDPE
jgi:chlorobactene glucosyltransferase